MENWQVQELSSKHSYRFDCSDFGFDSAMDKSLSSAERYSNATRQVKLQKKIYPIEKSIFELNSNEFEGTKRVYKLKVIIIPQFWRGTWKLARTCARTNETIGNGL